MIWYDASTAICRISMGSARIVVGQVKTGGFIELLGVYWLD